MRKRNAGETVCLAVFCTGPLSKTQRRKPNKTKPWGHWMATGCKVRGPNHAPGSYRCTLNSEFRIQFPILSQALTPKCMTVICGESGLLWGWEKVFSATGLGVTHWQVWRGKVKLSKSKSWRPRKLELTEKWEPCLQLMIPNEGEIITCFDGTSSLSSLC